MKLTVRSWTWFLQRNRQRHSFFSFVARLFPQWRQTTGRKRPPFLHKLRPLTMQGLEPRQLLTASLQVFNGSTQLNNGSGDSFGTVNVGASDVQTWTLKNVGNSTLTISSDSLPGGFSSSTSTPINIAPQQSTSFTVTMNTGSPANYSGPLTLSTNDPSNASFMVYLSGAVQQSSGGGTIQLFDGATQLTNGSNDTFPSVTVGSSDSKSFSVHNVASSTLTVSSVNLPSGYTLNGSLPLSVPPNQSASFSVSLNTSTAGTYGGQMLLSSSDTAHSPLAVNLSGTVTAPPAPSMSLSDGSNPITNGGNDSFGTVIQGTTATKTFTVNNTGTASLTVSSISLPSDYTLQTSLPLNVTAGGSTTFIVALGTSSTGTFTGQMVMTTNDQHNNPYNVNLSATVNAQAPVIEVYDGQTYVPNDPSGSGANPDNFGTTYVGTPIQKTFDIANAGATAISITSGSLSLPAGFSLVGSWPTSVSPHGSIPFTVEFDPTAAGTASGELSFADSDPGGNVYKFAITAAATVPPAAIAVYDGATQLSNGASDSFGSTVVGTAVQKSFAVTNTGGQTLTISSASAPAGFVVNSSLPMDIAPGASAVLQVTMQAGSAGSLGGPLIIASNASGNNSFVVTLSGSVTGGGSLEVFDGSTQLTNGATDSLGNVTVGSTTSKTLTLTNAGAGPLVINSADGSSGFYLTTSMPLTIPAGQSAQVQISDYVYAAGSTGGRIMFQSNDQSNPTFAINISATASGGGSLQLSDSASQLSTGATDDFGTVEAGSSWSKMLTVTNTGMGSLTISSVSVPSGFALDTTLPVTLGPYQTASIVVGLNTSTPGTYSGPITITSDDATNSTYTVNVTTFVGASLASTGFDLFDGSTQLFDGSSDTFPTVSTGAVDLKMFRVVALGGGTGFGLAGIPGPGSGGVTINSVNLPTGFYLNTPLPLAVAAGQTTVLDVGLNSTVGSYSGPMTINAIVTSNPTFSGAYPGNPATTNYSMTVNLSATVTGSQPQLSVLDGGTTIPNGTGNDSFGTTTVGVPIDKTFVIRNSGTTSVALSNLSLPGGFSLVGSFPSSVAANNSATFEVQMNAAAPGGVSGLLSFSDGEFGGSSYSFGLSGTVNRVNYSGPPQISLAATANAGEGTLTPGSFTFTTNEPGVGTTVGYELSGTALPGVDYVPPLLATTITPGSSSSVVKIVPINNGPFNAVRQEIVLPPAAGGTYTLSLGSNTTSPLAYTATAAAVQAALAALPNVDAANVSVAGAGTSAQPFVVAWKGSLLSANVSQLSADGSNLLGALQPSVTSDSAGNPPSSAVQQVGFTTLGTIGTSGDLVVYVRQFTLTFDGQTTQPIYCTASASDVQTALTALSNIGGGNVGVVAGQAVGGQQTYLVYFQGALANQNLPQITVNVLPWTYQYGSAPGTPAPIQSTLAAGSAAQDASQTVATAGATGGTFTLSLDNNITSALPYNADAATVQAALAALPNVGTGNVSVTGNDGGPWTITFIGAKSDQAVDSLVVNPFQLTGGQIQTSSLPAVSGPLTVTLQMLPSPTLDGVVNYVIAGQSSATIQITDGQPTMTVSEGGNGIAKGGGPVNFGTTPFGQSASETFTITNAGSDTLMLDPGSLSLPTGFSLAGSFPSSIAAGASANFTLQMSAATAGALSGSVSFTDNYLANTPFTFTVDGNVSQPVPEAALDLFGPGHLTVTPVADGSGSVSFGQTNLNVPINEDFRIDNLGQATLTLNPSSLNLPTGFSLVGSLPSSVSPGSSQNFTLQFQATTVGTASGTVSFATNDSANNPYSFTVSGTVNPPAPTLEVFDRGSLLKSGVSTVTFTTVAAGAATPATETLTITNAGTAQLNLNPSSITLPSGYSVVTPFASTVAVGGSTTVVIQLSDSTAGSYSGIFSFGTNDATADPFTVTLTGQVLPAPAIKVYDGSTLIAAGTGSDSFGAASQGAPLIKNFTIENTGSNSISITTSSLTVPSGFSIPTPLPSSLAAGQIATFAIQLNAANVGSYSGAVSFSDTDTGNNPYTFQISGQVVPPGPTNVTITGFQLANDTNGTSNDPVTYDPRVTGVVNGTFTSGYVVVQFDDSGSGTPQGTTSHITSSGTSFTYDPRTGDPALASGTINLRYRIASFDAAGTETDGSWNEFQFTLIPVPVGAHVDHLALVNDTGTSATDGLTYDPRVTGMVNGPFVGNSAQVDFTIIPATGSQATGVVSGILYAGQPFTFNPEAADPALVGYAGPLTLQYYAVDLDPAGKVVHTGDTQTFTMTMYAPTPLVSISGFGLLDDTDPNAATLSTADPRVTGTVSGLPSGETVSVEFSHHGDGVVNGSVAITSSTLTFTYDPRTKESALANYVGPLNLEYRTVEIDAKGGEIDGSWTSFPFNMEQATTPATTQNLQLSNVTISAGPPPVTSDPTLSGTVTATTISAPPTVQIDTNGDGVPDGSVTAGSNGAFSIVPTTLPFGNTTINVRAVEYDPSRTIYLYGAWTSILFDYEPPPAPTITSFTLADDTGGTSNPGHTTNDSLKGTIGTPPSGDSVQVEFDTTGTGNATASVPVSGTSFSFTPDWLPFGQVTVQARTVLLATSGAVLDHGNWTPLTFTYLGTPGTAPGISGLQLAHPTGTSGGVPTASDATLTGTVSAASGNAYQTVEYDINGDGVPDGTTTTDASGNFNLTPQGLAAGTVTVAVRAKAWDSQSQGDLEGAWQTITFDYQPAVEQPIDVSQFSVANNLSDSTSAPAATDPTVLGQLTVANPQSAPSSESAAYVTVQIDTNAGSESPGSYTPNASTTADASGAFQFTPSGLAYGSVTIAARAEYYNYSSDSLSYGPWTTSTFNYEQLTYTPPTIDSLVLASDTGGSANPGQTANPTVTGHVSGDTWSVAGSAPSSALPSATTFVEFDTNGDGTPDGYTWPDANGNFVYTPKYLSYGAATINARVESWSPTQNTLVAGSWTPLTFSYVNEPNTAPVLTSLGLADSTGAVTTSTTSIDASPVIAGQVTYESALSGITIQFDTTGSGMPDATAATDDYGKFQFTPSGLVAGNVTIHARTYVVDDVTHQVLTGPWTPFTFTWQPPAASPLAVGTLTLANGTTDSSGNLTATDPTVTGQVTGDGDAANQIVQFDTNASSQSPDSYAPNASATTDSAGNFTYTPTGLSAGTVIIAARVEDTAADGTPIYSPWTSLTFAMTATGTVVSQLVLANPAVVNGSTNPSIASDPTVTGTVAPASGGGTSIDNVTVEFDTNGDGQPNGSVQTNSQGQFTYTPTVEYGSIVTVVARTEGWIDGVETPSAWVPLTFLYTSDLTSVATQTELTALSQADTALATAQGSHDNGLATAQSNYATGQATAAGGYHKSEASASNTSQSTVTPAETSYASQITSANGGYNTSAAQAATNFASSIASFSGNTASYSIGNLTQWPDAPAAPTADDSYQPNAPVQAPTYTGPTFDEQEDAGYQSDVTIAEDNYNTAIQTATDNYNLGVESAQTTYHQAVELAEEQRYLALQTAADVFYATVPTSQAAGATPTNWADIAEADQALVQAEAIADQGYTLSMAQAQQNENDSLAQATHDQAYAVADAESALAQGVANANAVAFADWASVLGTPWAQYQAQLAENEAQFFLQDAPAQDTMARGEADAQYTKAKALDEATYDDEKTLADALKMAQVNNSLAQEQLTFSDLQSEQYYSGLEQQIDATYQQQENQIGAALQAAIQAATTQAEVAAAEAAYGAMSYANMVQWGKALGAEEAECSNAQIANDLAVDPSFTQDGYTYAIAQATAEANFHRDNANAERDAIVSTAEADQTYSDADAGYQGSLDLANAQSEQAFAISVSNQYTSQMQAWAASDGSSWAQLQSALASADGSDTQAIAQANVDHVKAMSTANTNWTIAYDAAEEQQTADDANSLADSVGKAADAQITAATTVAGKAQSEFNQDASDLAAFYTTENDLQAPNTAAAATALEPLDVNLFDQLAGRAVGFATTQAGANGQVNTDEASAAYTLAVEEADHEKTKEYQEAEADQTLAMAQVEADGVQAHAQALAQAGLDVSSTAAQQVYNVAIADDLETQTTALATAAPGPLTNYWAAVATANANQAISDQTAVNNYEIAATGADVQLSDDQATAEYNYTFTTSGADLLEAQKIADAVHLQSVSDAGYTQQTAIAAAGSLADNEIAIAQAQRADATAAAQVRNDWVDDWYPAWAAVTTNSSSSLSNFTATMRADVIGLTSQYAGAETTLAQDIGEAGVTPATETGNDVSNLASELEGDANTEVTTEQGATLTDAQTVDAAGVTRAIALAQAQANYALTTGNAQIGETLGEGSAAVADATGVAAAEANYQIGIATTDDNAAHAWASSNGSAAAVFDAAYADAELSWLSATSSAYITDKTNQAQADANYANEAAGLDASLTVNTTAQDGSLAITQAQLYQAEQDAITGYEQDFAITETSQNGADTAGRMEALAHRSIASAQDEETWLATQAQNTENWQAAVASIAAWWLVGPGPATPSWVYTDPHNGYYTGEANANLTWVNATTSVDWTQQTTVADADQSRGDHEADAELSYAQQAADAQWTHDENVAALQEANAATLAGYEQSREEAYASDDAALQTAEYTSAAGVMGSLSSAVGTPWAQYLAGVANAASTWWSSNESSYLGYQNTLAGDQAAESVAVAQAAQTQANAMADADHTLAYAQADAAHTQAVDDDAAQQAEQTADATNNENYQQSLAEGQLNAVLVPGFDSYANLETAVQTYLSAEMNAQNTLTTTTNGDALTDSTSLADAQLAWTESSDAATEGYLYSTALADDTQVHDDAQVTAQFQTNSAASYASAVQSFDQANPSPWADYASAMASAQSTLTSNSASALMTEQIALADADLGQSTADALAQQALDDAQAAAATNLSNAQQTAESNLATAQAVFDNAVAFQYPSGSSQLPDQLEWGPGTPLTAWGQVSQGPLVPRDGVALPLALPYQAGYAPASGFGATALSERNIFGGMAFGNTQPAIDDLVGFFPNWPGPLSDVSWSPSVAQWHLMLPVALAPVVGISFGVGIFAPTGDMTMNASTILSRALPGSNYAPFPAPPAPSDFMFAPGSAQQLNISQFPSPGAMLPPPGLTPPVSDDAAHQDYVNGMALVNPSWYAASDHFDASPLGQISAGAQGQAPVATTAAEQVQDTEAKVADDAAAATNGGTRGGTGTVARSGQADAEAPPDSSATSLTDQSNTSQVTIDFAKHIETPDFMKIVSESKGQFRLAPKDPNAGILAGFHFPLQSPWKSTLGESDVYILDLNTPDGPKKLVFARHIDGIPFWASEGADVEVSDYYALAEVVDSNVSDLAAAQGVYAAEKSGSVGIIQGTLTFALHMVPLGAAADHYSQGESEEMWLSLAADATLVLGGVGKVWQATRAGKVLLGTAVAIDGGFAAYSATQTVKFAVNGDWIKAAGAGGETLLRLYGFQVMGKSLVSALSPLAARWIGSKISPEASQAALDRLIARIRGLRAGGTPAIQEVRFVGSRASGFSQIKNRGPLANSDVDLAVSDLPGLKASRYDANVVSKIKGYATEFTDETGITVEIHLRSRYSTPEWQKLFGGGSK
ncbi:MAG TPA: choice-of-anchor D domain-containing protein [Pirellulales bacterium]|nr:choice-of-anchor D domain-containing protein [Pirellulales bacterium]